MTFLGLDVDEPIRNSFFLMGNSGGLGFKRDWKFFIKDCHLSPYEKEGNWIFGCRKRICAQIGGKFLNFSRMFA